LGSCDPVEELDLGLEHVLVVCAALVDVVVAAAAATQRVTHLTYAIRQR
jgi:hypothetical protein